MKSILLTCLIFLSFHSISQSSENAYSTGVFTYIHQGTEVTVTRTKKKLIEAFGDSKMIFKIKWLDETHYEAKLIRMIKIPKGCLKKGDIMTVALSNFNSKGHVSKGITKNCGSASVQLIKKK